MREVKEYHRNKQIKCHYWVNEKGQFEGEYKIWDKNGQLIIHSFYKNGEFSGEYKSWHENGQLAVHCFYKNGLGESEYKNWHDNGQLAVHCFFKNGLKEGEYKRWWIDGPLWEHCFYHNNNLVDISEYAADKNNITEEEHFLLQLTFVYFPIIKFAGKL